MRIEDEVKGLLLLQGAMEHRLEDIDLNKGNKFMVEGEESIKI